MNASISLAVIGGSGLYSMKGLEDVEQLDIDTPFGKTSAPILIGSLEGKRIAFLARHGIGHHLIPSDVPYCANIYALKKIGAERVVSISACGSLKEEFAPGHIVIPDQVFDFTKNRRRTFFGDGLVAHISVADPFCSELSKELEKALVKIDVPLHLGGSFITIEGPRFSTRVESNTFRSWGMNLIGMTTSPEVFLAKEAELCYTVMAHVTDYDVWHSSTAPVTVEMVIRTLNKNTELAQEAIRLMVRDLKSTRDCDCDRSLASALITQPEVIPMKTRQKLDLLINKYL